MKHRLCFFITGFVTALSTLSADVDSGDYGSEQMADLKDKPTPFKFDVRTDIIGPAKTTTKGFRHGEKLHYNESQADLSAVFYYDECHKEALAVQVGFNNTQLYWDHNPSFDQKNFGNLGVVLGGVTQRLCGWTWQAFASLNMDTRNLGINNYSTYDLLLWGKYGWRDDINVHVGFLGWTGLNIDKILPILGFDWTFCDKWQLNAVFPINISLIYTINDSFNIAAAGRFFWNRHRIEKSAFLSEGIWEYRNSGAELALNYALRNFVTLNVHGGYTFGGNVKISTKNHKHTKKYRFDGAPYVGGELAIHF